LRLGANGGLWRDLEELLAVTPRQVGNRPDLPFHPQEGMRKRGDVAHVDAGTHDNPAWIQGFERGRHQRPNGSEDQGGIEGLWRRTRGVASPFGPKASREPLLLGIARRRKGENAPALKTGDLRDDVRGVAEAIEPDALSIARQPQGAIADQAGAEQRCGMQIRITLGQRKTEALVGDAILSVAAIDVIAGEARVHAQVLETTAAKAAGLVDRREPGNANA